MMDIIAKIEILKNFSHLNIYYKALHDIGTVVFNHNGPVVDEFKYHCELLPEFCENIIKEATAIKEKLPTFK
jgi:hypothetical protein